MDISIVGTYIVTIAAGGIHCYSLYDIRRSTGFEEEGTIFRTFRNFIKMPNLQVGDLLVDAP